jgi:pimeloyl-ACP methyl ester carboxylesterase
MLELPNRFTFEGSNIAWGMIGDGEPLVLLHGTPFSSQVWRRIAPWLAKRHRVFFYDLIGYGQSDKPAEDVSLGRQNKLLVAILREWRLERPRVLAHDFGGATALRAHFLDGIGYSALTLVDPVAISPQGSPFVAHVRKHEAAFAGLPAYAHEALLSAYIANSAARPLSIEALSIYRAPWLGETGQVAFYRQIAQMDQRYIQEAEARYARPDFPVRILWGEDDAWIPLAQGRQLADKLTAGELMLVPGTGHLVQEDAPEAIIAAAFEAS